MHIAEYRPATRGAAACLLPRNMGIWQARTQRRTVSDMDSMADIKVVGFLQKVRSPKSTTPVTDLRRRCTAGAFPRLHGVATWIFPRKLEISGTHGPESHPFRHGI